MTSGTVVNNTYRGWVRAALCSWANRSDSVIIGGNGDDLWIERNGKRVIIVTVREV